MDIYILKNFAQKHKDTLVKASIKKIKKCKRLSFELKLAVANPAFHVRIASSQKN